MAYGVTADGFSPKSLIDIIPDMSAEALVQFGADVDLTSTSPLKKFIQVIAAEELLMWDALEEAYNAGYLDFATGSSLDNLTALIGFVRIAAIKSTGEVTFTGTNGTVVPADTSVQTVGSDPDIFTTDVAGTVAAGTITVAVTASTAGVDGNVAGATITVLTSPISGISAVTNTNPTTGGTDTETDIAYRNRIKISLSAGGSATLDAIRAGVLLVTGVVSASIVENDTTGVVGGLPAKSFEVTVLGGADNDIAQGIFDEKPAGIESFGGDSGTAQDSAGNNYTIDFQRATEILIYVSATVTSDSTYPTDGDTQVETAIITYIGGTDADAVVHLGLGIGDDVIFNEVISAILSIQGVTDASVTIDTTTPPVGTGNETIAAGEKATSTTTSVVIS